MRVLSLFDGMACGMIAFRKCGIWPEEYHAYEIDKYAVKTAQHNFPMILEHGDVFEADFTVYRGRVNGVIGGSPCTFWSIAQKKNRETTPNGIGGRLFEQYFRAIEEAQPEWFIYENNKSMSKAIREYISGRFGFEPICINSALVSAQNRQRLYWVGRRNQDGTYRKVDAEQPANLGTLLKDILDGSGSKGLTEREMEYMVRETSRCGNHFSFGYIQKGYEEKAKCLTANIGKGVPYNVLLEPIRVGTYPGSNSPENDSRQYRVFSVDGKSVTLCGTDGGLGAATGLYAIRVGDMPNSDGDIRGGQAHRIYSADGKAVALCARPNGGGVDGPLLYALPVRTRLHADGVLSPWATVTEWDSGGNPVRAKSGSDDREYTVYHVSGGQITVNFKTYPIRVFDGYYIIRKLTVSECKRLQTVPEWYEFPVSDSQAYKMLGNGWTVDVIAHLIRACLSGENAEEQTRIF